MPEYLAPIAKETAAIVGLSKAQGAFPRGSIEHVVTDLDDATAAAAADPSFDWFPVIDDILANKLYPLTSSQTSDIDPHAFGADFAHQIPCSDSQVGRAEVATVIRFPAKSTPYMFSRTTRVPRTRNVAFTLGEQKHVTFVRSRSKVQGSGCNVQLDARTR